MHICTVIKGNVQTLQAERKKYVFKRNLDDDNNGAHQTSFGIEFQTEEEAKENERSPSVALLCSSHRHMMVQYCCGSGSTNMRFCKRFLSSQEANEVILNVWLY